MFIETMVGDNIPLFFSIFKIPIMFESSFYSLLDSMESHFSKKLAILQIEEAHIWGELLPVYQNSACDFSELVKSQVELVNTSQV